MKAGGRYVALFSGGKDSYLSILLAREQGVEVSELLTIDAPRGSYLYHTPALKAVDTIAATIDHPHRRIRLTSMAPVGATSEEAARHEIEPLRRWLQKEAHEGVDGLVTGVVESRYQRNLLQQVTDETGIDLVTPLWGVDGHRILEMVQAFDLEVDIVAVAAAGLDQSWLGRRLNSQAIDDLRDLATQYGIHIAGEGGEFETLVVDGPEFDRPIRYQAEPHWHGTYGYLELTEVSLGDRV